MKIKFFLSLFLISTGVFSQNTDQEIAQLLNQKNFFELKKTYPFLKEKASPFIQSLSESLLHSYFNKPQKACSSIENFFSLYQGQIDASLATNLIYLWAENLNKQGKFKHAKKLIDQYLLNFQSKEHDELKKLFNTIYLYCKVYEHFPSTQKNQNNNTEITIAIKKTGNRGFSMYVPVEINQNKTQFLFDTGAGDNIITEKFAKENNIKVFNDSIKMIGTGELYAKFGLIDSLNIGNIHLKNITCLVVPVDPQINLLNEPILGIPFLRLFNEIKIYPKQQRIVFPNDETNFLTEESNLLISNNNLIVNTKLNNKTHPLLFDSGNVETTLFYQYFSTYNEKFYKKDTIEIGGFGGVNKINCFRIPSIELQIGENNFTRHNIPVLIQNQNSNTEKYYGSLGADFIFKCNLIIINLNKMQLEAKIISKDKISPSSSLNTHLNR